MHIHILGICGTFMGGLAVLARQAGHRVTGCDSNVYPPMSTQLAAQGIELIEGFSPDQLALKPDLFVIGNVVKRGNPLMEAILRRGLAYTSGPQWLADHVLRDKWVLAVAGTHGKTTTSAMLAWILDYAQLHPGFLIGGVPQNFGVSARLTTPAMQAVEGGDIPPFFVLEADEYDTAFFDKRSKFVHYRPRTAILNNLEYDHADIFPDLAAIQTQFHHLVRTIPDNGLIIHPYHSTSLQQTLARGCWTPCEQFGQGGEWEAIHATGDGHFDVCFKGERQGRVTWSLLGEHNQSNALAALAAARHVGVPIAIGIEALNQFANVKRRMEVRGCVNNITVYDDFAHHPTAIATTLAGLRNNVGQARILAVLEPRSNTMKLGVMKAQLPDSLQQADMVFAYAGGIDWDLSTTLAPLGHRAHVEPDLDTLVNTIADQAQTGDHILVMSNGGFGGIHTQLLQALTQRLARSA